MERKRVNALFMIMAFFLGIAPVTLAQRGMGDAIGVVRQGIKPEIVTLQGKVVRTITGPCEKTTGPSDMGTHFILKVEQGQEQNIHLGPAHLVQGVTDLLAHGSTVSVCGFRTDKMPQGHYNAVTVMLGNKTIRLRGENLRPVWAGRTGSVPDGADIGQVNSRHNRRGWSARWPGGSYQRLQPSPHGCRFRSPKRSDRGQGRGRCCQGRQSRRRMQRSIW